MKKTDEKAFNATVEGQRAMCEKSMSDATLLVINRKIKQMGGTAWSEAQLAQLLSTASPALRQSLLDDLINDYNALCSLSDPLGRQLSHQQPA